MTDEQANAICKVINNQTSVIQGGFIYLSITIGASVIVIIATLIFINLT